MNENELMYIEELALKMRIDALELAYSAGNSAAHFGGGVSLIDILAVLYGKVMNLDVENPLWEERDRFILSKGHGVLGYYAALCEIGYISKEELKTFEKHKSDLLGHPVRKIEKGIEYTTGSLGQGLSIGIGNALALKENGLDSKVYVLLGDGECNEGSVWEAAMSAAQFKLDNLVAIIDRNNYQLGGHTCEIMDIGDVSAKLKAFGWETRVVNGHDHSELYRALSGKTENGKPLAVIAQTIKGYGFSFAENNNAWHHSVITTELYENAKKELEEKCKTLYGGNIEKKRTQKKDVECEGSSDSNYVFELTGSIARRWSMIGQRAAFGLAILEEAKHDKTIKMLTADVSTSAGLERYRRSLPEQYLDVGIAEQNMMGIATGYASMGYKVVTATFAPFQSMRCLEQIRVNLGYMGEKVIMAGLASGIVLGTLGNTHCCFEDIGVLRAIPNIAIVSPADAGEVGKALSAALKYPSSVYIRLMNAGNCPIINKEDYEFEIGKAITLKDALKKDGCVTIFAAGTMVNESLLAAEILEQYGIEVKVINMHTIKPIDEECIKEACQYSKMIVTVEEHSVYGGLGTAVAEVMAGIENTPSQLVLGLPDEYGHGGEYRELLKEYGLTAEQIAKKIVDKLN